MGYPTKNFKTARRYRINPLELVIFSLVTVGFAYSVLHLFKDADQFKFATLQPMQAQPTRQVPNRAIASIGGAVDGVSPVAHPMQIEINCAENPGFRFAGQICPNSPSSDRVIDDSPKYNPYQIK